jgi:hypothetical protein
MGFSTRLSFAVRGFFSILFRGKIPPDIEHQVMESATPAHHTDTAQRPSVLGRAEQMERSQSESLDRAIQMLYLLQRDGRFVDFLTEDVSPYPDSQLGAAVRTIHASCRQVLERYVKLEAIIASEEGQAVTVQAGFDPASIKLIGHVTGAPPIRGLLRHRGWRVTELNLPSIAHGSGSRVVAPAEVEIP